MLPRYAAPPTPPAARSKVAVPTFRALGVPTELARTLTRVFAEEPGAGRIDPHVLQRDRAARRCDQRGRQQERRRGEIPGYVQRHAREPRRPSHGHGSSADRHGNAHLPQHPLGMVAAARRLGEARFPFGKEPGQQHGALHLGTGDLGRHRAGPHRAAALHHYRRLPSFARAHARAELPQRRRDALHRPSRQGRVSHQPPRHAGARQDATEEPQGGARVAAIEIGNGSAQPAQTHAEHDGVVRTHVGVALRNRLRSRGPRGRHECRLVLVQKRRRRRRDPGRSVSAQERHAELRQAARGRAHIAPGREPRQTALPLCQRGEKQRAVRDALVPRYAQSLRAHRLAQRMDARLHAATRCSPRPIARAIASTSRIS